MINKIINDKINIFKIMGNKWDNYIVKKEEVEKNIEKINELTRKYALIEFICLYLEFSLDENVFFSNKIIRVKVKKFNPKKGKVEDEFKIVRLTIEQFYTYYNALMNSLNIFYEKRLEERLKTLVGDDFDNIDNDESSLCPICEEKKVQICLPCCHFFCEQCIKTWVIKSETCPLCRFKLKNNKKNEEKDAPVGIEGIQRWSILSNNEEIQKEIKKNNFDIFLKLSNNLFYTK